MLNLSLQRKLNRIDEIMFYSPGNYYIKDLNGSYIYLNQNSLDVIGANRPDNMLGKTDADFPWAEYTDIYRSNDKLITRNNQSQTFQEPSADYTESLMVMCSQKRPFYHKGEIVGVAGVSIAIPHVELNTSSLLTETNTYIDTRDKRKLTLSNRQKEVLSWLLRGLPARIIAIELNISQRTVEHHITNIRQCNDYCSLKDMLLHVQAL